jgi:hypothetical protein
MADHDTVTAAVTDTQAARLDAELAAKDSEAAVTSGSSGVDPHAEPVRNEEDALTLFCVEDGTSACVPSSVAVAESELICSLLEDVEGSADGMVVRVPWINGEQATAFAAFLRARVAGSGPARLPTGRAEPVAWRPKDDPRLAEVHALDAAGDFASAACLLRVLLCEMDPLGHKQKLHDHLTHLEQLALRDDEWRSFGTLYGAASYLIAPQWQQRLADELGSLLIDLTNAGDHEAVNIVVTREEATLDPEVSPLLTMLAPEAVAAVLVVLGRQPGHSVVGWAERELDKAERRAKGWLVVGVPSAGGNELTCSRDTVRQQVLDAKAVHIVIRPGTTSIGKEAFYMCSSLASVAIPNSVRQIGSDAFAGCLSLVSVTIPDSVTRIDANAFAECSSLVSVAIPNSVTQIADRAFGGCSSLASVAIPNSVTQISNSTFFRCSSLAAVEIPDSVTQIGQCAFFNCSSLASVAIPDSVTQIGGWAFADCSSLSFVAIPSISNSLMQIGDRAFSGCSLLASVAIPDSVTQIGDRAFSGCSLLASVAIPDSVTKIGVGAFAGCSLRGDVVAAFGEEIFREEENEQYD